ncbi:MAG: hypothetical protein HRU31_10385 [Rhodobacteraceae bacterium]|nr:hypothetical protein [Paracoccaceae bacterium]
MHRPQTEAELAEIVAGSDVPLRICGGGTRGIDGPGAGWARRSAIAAR